MKINEAVLDAMRTELAKHINGHRLEHSLAVEAEAAALGMLFKMSEDEIFKLRAAAILHDITKALDTVNQIDLCQKHGIELSMDDLKSPKVLHSISGAAIAREMFSEYVDDDIYNAILNHTTGAERMSLYDKLIYLADYIEPTRTFVDCVHLRGYFYESDALPTEKHLNKTLLLSFDKTLRVLLEEKQFIHPRTVKARNGILNELSKYK